jgi:hypothetical protein
MRFPSRNREQQQLEHAELKGNLDRLGYNFGGLISAADEREERKACCGTSSIPSDGFQSPRLENALLMKHTQGPWQVAGSMRIAAERVSIAVDVLNSEYLFSDTPRMVGADNAIHNVLPTFFLLFVRYVGLVGDVYVFKPFLHTLASIDQLCH